MKRCWSDKCLGVHHVGMGVINTHGDLTPTEQDEWNCSAIRIRHLNLVITSTSSINICIVLFDTFLAFFLFLWNFNCSHTAAAAAGGGGGLISYKQTSSSPTAAYHHHHMMHACIKMDGVERVEMMEITPWTSHFTHHELLSTG